MTTTTGPAPTTAQAGWDRWRAERTAELSRPHGWLSVTALHWLTAHGGGEELDGVPGRWGVAGDAVHLWARAADGLVADGAAVDGELVLHPVDGAPGVEVHAGRRVLEVLRRGSSWALRVRDPGAPALAGFTGVPVFDHDPAWIRTGVFEPFDAARDVTVDAVVPGLTHTRSAPGTVTFPHDGSPVRLVAFSGPGDDLTVLFTDATTGVSTTSTVRSLRLAAPDGDGTVPLDFNRAANLPCAFTDHATCPLAPAGNRLPFPVEAGERDPR